MRRYDLENYEDSLSIMDVAPDGDWVDYDDAIEAIAEARQDAATTILELFRDYMDWASDSTTYDAFQDDVKAKFRLEG